MCTSSDSDVVVMTTEILRNIMYRSEEAGTPAAGEDRLATVGLVVLDEVRACAQFCPLLLDEVRACAQFCPLSCRCLDFGFACC